MDMLDIVDVCNVFDSQPTVSTGNSVQNIITSKFADHLENLQASSCGLLMSYINVCPSGPQIQTYHVTTTPYLL